MALRAFELTIVVALYCATAAAIWVLEPAPWRYIGLAPALIASAAGLRWLALRRHDRSAPEEATSP
jgi:hypothetical protein